MGVPGMMAQLGRRVRASLPSRQYLKLYVWTLCIFLVILVIVSVLFGQYLGYSVALTGGLIVAGMLAFVFSSALVFGVILYLFDPEK